MMNPAEPTQVAQYFHELAATLPAPPERAEEHLDIPRDSAVSSAVAARINDAASAHACGTLRNDSLTWAELPWFDVQISDVDPRVAAAADPPRPARSFADTFDALMRGHH